MSKALVILLIIVALAAGFMVYKNMGFKNQTAEAPSQTSQPAIEPSAQPSIEISPIFSYLPSWVPAATWSTPLKSTLDTSYGKLSGLESTGKITGNGSFKGRSFEDIDVLYNLGFKIEDINFAADGPGASVWGYTQTENGQSRAVIFSYSTQRLLGPESKSPPFANISVFVSDPFEIK